MLILLLIGIVYTAITVPLRLKMRWLIASQWSSSLVIDYFFDIVMIVEIVLRSRYFAFEKYENNTGMIDYCCYFYLFIIIVIIRENCQGCK